jgi:hypothetical protein
MPTAESRVRRTKRDPRIGGGDRDSGNPARIDAGFGQDVVDACLIRAQRAAALKHRNGGMIVSGV